MREGLKEVREQDLWENSPAEGIAHVSLWGGSVPGGREGLRGGATGAAVREAEGGWWKMTSGRNRGSIVEGS